MRKVGNRVRVTAQLIDAADKRPSLGRTLRPGASRCLRIAGGDYPHGGCKHRPADRSRRDSPFTARDDEPPCAATRLARRGSISGRDQRRRCGADAAGNRRIRGGDCRRCSFARSSLHARWAHWVCHLYRWGDRPDAEIDRAWAVVERMTAINSQDERTLTVRGLTRVNRGEYGGGLADLRRAYRDQSELRNCPHCAGVYRGDHGLGPGGGSARSARSATQSDGTTVSETPTWRWQWRTSH